MRRCRVHTAHPLASSFRRCTATRASSGSPVWSSWQSNRSASGKSMATTRTRGLGVRTATDGRLPRFGRTERAVHWVHAGAFIVLLTTGLCLYLPSMAQLVGRRPLVKSLHIYTAVGWAIALLLIIALGDRAALHRTATEIDTFDRD